MATAALERKKAKRLWTYNELLAELPETNQPTELWDGELSIDVFALVEGAYRLHSHAQGAGAVRSRLLAGFFLAYPQVASWAG